MSSSGPGCSPLKATTRVQIPTSLPGLNWAGVVQSAERRLGKAEIAGSSPAVSSSWVRLGGAENSCRCSSAGRAAGLYLAERRSSRRSGSR